MAPAPKPVALDMFFCSHVSSHALHKHGAIFGAMDTGVFCNRVKYEGMLKDVEEYGSDKSKAVVASRKRVMEECLEELESKRARLDDFIKEAASIMHESLSKRKNDLVAVSVSLASVRANKRKVSAEKGAQKKKEIEDAVDAIVAKVAEIDQGLADVMSFDILNLIVKISKEAEVANVEE